MGSFSSATIHEGESLRRFDDLTSLTLSPKTLTKHIVDKWLAPGGMLVIGLDHYIGNPDSYSWAKDLNVHMTLKDEKEWVQIFKSAGLSSCYNFRVNASNEFPGTLCVVGQLKN